MFEGIGGILTLGIEDGDGIRQFVIRYVMVTHNKVDAKRLGITDFIDCLDAAIEHNNKFDVFLCSRIQRFLTDTIAFLIAVGNVVLNVGIELLQELVHQSYRRTSVDIVVAIYHDSLFTPHSVVEPVYSHVHVVHQERVYQFV